MAQNQLLNRLRSEIKASQRLLQADRTCHTLPLQTQVTVPSEMLYCSKAEAHRQHTSFKQGEDSTAEQLMECQSHRLAPYQVAFDKPICLRDLHIKLDCCSHK